MSPIGYSHRRAHFIREQVLRMLWDMHNAVPGVVLLAEHIYRAFADSQSQFTRAEIEAEVAELVDRGLIDLRRCPPDAAGPPEISYTSTPRGRDFVRADYPWDRMDEFCPTEGRR